MDLSEVNDDVSSDARVTVKEQLDSLPAGSVTVYDMEVVVPFSNMDPGAGPPVCETRAEQLSKITGVGHVAIDSQADN